MKDVDLEFYGIDLDRVVNILPLKRFSSTHLNEYPLLQQLILEERDSITSEEFILKVGTWLKILEKSDLVSSHSLGWLGEKREC
jgi:hypothetical protein